MNKRLVRVIATAICMSVCVSSVVAQTVACDAVRAAQVEGQTQEEREARYWEKRQLTAAEAAEECWKRVVGGLSKAIPGMPGMSDGIDAIIRQAVNKACRVAEAPIDEAGRRTNGAVQRGVDEVNKGVGTATRGVLGSGSGAPVTVNSRPGQGVSDIKSNGAATQSSPSLFDNLVCQFKKC